MTSQTKLEHSGRLTLVRRNTGVFDPRRSRVVDPACLEVTDLNDLVSPNRRGRTGSTERSWWASGRGRRVQDRAQGGVLRLAEGTLS